MTKPGIIRGNILIAIGGFFFASGSHVNLVLLIALLSGTSLLIASACVFNNYLDRHIDVAMERTKDRALVTGDITPRQALMFALILGIAGLFILSRYTNPLTVLIGVIGFFSYVLLYGWIKRISVHGTLVGTISGSTPIVAGYVSVTNSLDTSAALLFLILVFWQMAHFFGIAMYRHDDYASAKIPVLPVIKGMEVAKKQTLLYILAFLASTSLLTIVGHAKITFAIVMAAISLYWFWLGFKDYKNTPDDNRWGRKMFLFSLIVILTFSIMLSINSFLP